MVEAGNVASANSHTIRINDWGFRGPDSESPHGRRVNVVFRRYTGDYPQMLPGNIPVALSP